MSQFASVPAPSIAVSAVSATLMQRNLTRREVVVCNTHATQDAYVQLATVPDGTVPTAVVGSGMLLKANGGSWASNTWKGAAAVIGSGAGSVTCTEF